MTDSILHDMKAKPRTPGRPGYNHAKRLRHEPAAAPRSTDEEAGAPAQVAKVAATHTSQAKVAPDHSPMPQDAAETHPSASVPRADRHAEQTAKSTRLVFVGVAIALALLLILGIVFGETVA